MFIKKSAWILLFCFVLAPLALAADVYYPYVDLRFKVAPSQNPFPGLGSGYSTLSKGMKTTFWNPASLGKLKLSEASFDTVSTSLPQTYSKTSSLDESSSTAEGGVEYGFFFRSPEEIGTGINTTEVNLISSLNYATESTGTNFSSALKVNDWLSVGFASNSPVGFDLGIAGELPTTVRSVTDLRGTDMSPMQITSAGKLQYTFDSGSSVTTYESTQNLWSGFLSQEATIPLTTLTELRNNVAMQSPYAGTVAINHGNFFAGLNLVPVSATMNLENDIRTVVNSDTEDIFLYVPDFDSENETDLSNWINDPDRYSTSAGYRRKQLKLPSGDIIATAKYRGVYHASTARMDIGSIWDITDWFTVGVAMENMGGANLDFAGSNLAAYYSYREVNTAETGSMDELMQPGGKSSFELISDRWISSTEAGDTPLYLEPEKTYELPKKIRYGFALKRPFLIAVDFEKNQTPIKYISQENNVPTETIISDINYLRVGLESQLLFFPAWSRLGLTLMSKPTITGLTAEAQASLDDAFQFGYLPVRLDLGLEINFWGTIVGNSTTINPQIILNSLQLDIYNADLNKLLYTNLYFNREAWTVSYITQVDPIATGIGYSNKTVAAGTEKAFEISDLKFVNTIGVTYRF
ncbi:MAG: hypothetical protein ABIE84_03140 [bacterium]